MTPGHTVSLLEAQIRGISPFAQVLFNSPLPPYSLSGLAKDEDEEEDGGSMQLRLTDINALE